MQKVQVAFLMSGIRQVGDVKKDISLHQLRPDVQHRLRYSFRTGHDIRLRLVLVEPFFFLLSHRAQHVLKCWWISYIRSRALYLRAHAHCRAGPGVDCNSVEVLVMWRVVRKVVDSPVFLRNGICSLAGHPPRDVQTHTQQQHAQHCRITGHAEVEERE